MRVPSLHLIVDLSWSPRRVEDAVLAGVDVVQLRDKGAAAADLFRMARTLKAITERHRALLFVNDRIDVALAAEADGVHLARKSLPPDAARRVAGDLILGMSVHERSEVERYSPLVDYVTFGSVFPTATHPEARPKEVEGLREAVRASKAPVLAIGGIAPENVAMVLAAGAKGVVVISAIRSAGEDVVLATVRLRRALDEAAARLGLTHSL